MTLPGTTDNKGLVRAAFEAMSTHFGDMSRGDGSNFSRHLRDDVIWVNNGLPEFLPSRWAGKAALVLMFQHFARHVQGRFTWQIKQILGDGDVVVLVTDGACRTRAGRPYTNRYCFVVRVLDGLIAEVTEYMNNAYVIAAFA
jgi:ketosteroid isomerase-like protein